MSISTTKETLNITHPELASEWHLTLNGYKIPQEFTAGSEAKIWWKCPICHYNYEAVIQNRSRGTRCPYCFGNAVNKENCLAVINPKLAREWHTTENGYLTPNDVRAFSIKKVKWICDDCKSTYVASIANRSGGTNCPYCFGDLVNDKNCLATTHVYLAKEWHPSLNGEKTPKNYKAGSGAVVWWQCPKFEEDVYQAPINKRADTTARGCPFCIGRRVNNRNCLATTHPHLVVEWHSVLNGDKTPNTITHCHGKKVWWQCPNSIDHIYYTAVYNRTIGLSGCPDCSRSKNANLTFQYLTEILPKINISKEYKVHITGGGSRPKQIDFCFNVGDKTYFIEYNGIQHYKPVLWRSCRTQEQADEDFAKQIKRDSLVDEYCKENSIKLIVVDCRKHKGTGIKSYLEKQLIGAGCIGL